MKKWAQIVNGMAHWIFTSDAPEAKYPDGVPAFAPNIVLVEITNRNPMPQEGWIYDEANEVFSEPAPPPVTWFAIRAKRDFLLSKTDFSQLPDNQLTPAKVSEWEVYRQALRDLPQTFPDVETIIWPEEPEK
ncbi:MAG: phage tail assembly chaperone [Phycisphaeraceae bacterium]|nr:phage tail assembly chaperone [Phycisphaeraceae bacterium]